MKGGLVNFHNKTFDITFSFHNIFGVKNCGRFIRRFEVVARIEENVKYRSDKLTGRDHEGAANIDGSLILREYLDRNKL